MNMYFASEWGTIVLVRRQVLGVGIVVFIGKLAECKWELRFLNVQGKLLKSFWVSRFCANGKK